MFTVQNVAIGVALLFFGWYFVGSFLNRRRSQELIQAIRRATAGLGADPTIKWFGRAAFQVDLAEASPPFREIHLLCVLEPRDFPVAMVWNRLRRRRDQVLIHASYTRPPRDPGKADPGGSGVPGLTGLELKAEPPHLQMALQVPAGQEATIGQALELAVRLGGR